MCAYRDTAKRAVILLLAVVLALVYGAFNTFVRCVTTAHFIPLLPLSIMLAEGNDYSKF